MLDVHHILVHTITIPPVILRIVLMVILVCQVIHFDINFFLFWED